MPWTIGYQNQKKFTKDLQTLQPAEDAKYLRWLGDVPTYGPQQASEQQHVDLKKISGGTDQWELLVGRSARIQMIINSQAERVELTGVGHL